MKHIRHAMQSVPSEQCLWKPLRVKECIASEIRSTRSALAPTRCVPAQVTPRDPRRELGNHFGRGRARRAGSHWAVQTRFGRFAAALQRPRRACDAPPASELLVMAAASTSRAAPRIKFFAYAHPPIPVAPRKRRVAAIPDFRCSVCGIQQTPQMRRAADGRDLCNRYARAVVCACGVFFARRCR